MAKRFPFTDFPSGWYVVGLASELAPKELRVARYFDKDLVLYRTEAGEFRISQPHCPHLGAHLGQGRVVGERLECGFHGWQFDGGGQCVQAYGHNVPKASTGMWTSLERNQLLMAWYDGEGREPSWAPPEVDFDGWTDFRFRKLELASHPQETSENSVDLGHFTHVHNFSKAWSVEDAVADGPVLRASYGVSRPVLPQRLVDLLKGALKTRAADASIDAIFHVEVHGLGYSLVLGEIPALKMKFRHLVLSTPTTDGFEHMHLGSSVKKYRSAAMTELAHRISISSLHSEVEMDRNLWETKRYVDRPVLAKGDGPIHTYRKWAKQFYPGAAEREVKTPIA